MARWATTAILLMLRVELGRMQVKRHKPHSLWNTQQPWNSTVVYSKQCPHRNNRLLSPMSSIRRGVRTVWTDDGTCLASGRTDAGTCIQRNQKIHCLPSFIIFGTGKGGTAELQVTMANLAQRSISGIIVKRMSIMMLLDCRVGWHAIRIFSATGTQPKSKAGGKQISSVVSLQQKLRWKARGGRISRGLRHKMRRRSRTGV